MTLSVHGGHLCPHKHVVDVCVCVRVCVHVCVRVCVCVCVCVPPSSSLTLMLPTPKVHTVKANKHDCFYEALMMKHLSI